MSALSANILKTAAKRLFFCGCVRLINICSIVICAAFDILVNSSFHTTKYDSISQGAYYENFYGEFVLESICMVL